MGVNPLTWFRRRRKPLADEGAEALPVRILPCPYCGEDIKTTKTANGLAHVGCILKEDHRKRIAAAALDESARMKELIAETMAESGIGTVPAPDENYTLTGDELIAGVLGILSMERLVGPWRFTLSDLQRIFYDARQTGLFDEFFKEYPYDCDGLAPHSESLSQGVSTMLHCELLDPDRRGAMKIGSEAAIRHRARFFLPKLPTPTRERLRLLAGIVYQRLNKLIAVESKM